MPAQNRQHHEWRQNQPRQGEKIREVEQTLAYETRACATRVAS
jgi:hypothetical protein